MQIEEQQSEVEAADTETESPPGGPIDADAADDGSPADDGEVDADGDGEEAESIVPDDPDGYELPEIEGFDKETAANSPIMASLRKAAHAAGMTQEAFNGAIEGYVADTVAKTAESREREIKALGANANQRLEAINTWIGSQLPEAQARALAASITSADAVKAIEALMGKGGRKAAAPVSRTPGMDRAEVEKLMASPSYSGRPNQRDPAVIAKVDAWWKAQAATAKK